MVRQDAFTGGMEEGAGQELLFDGFEGVADMLNAGTATVGPGHGDDVEACGMIEEAVPFKIGGCQEGELALLGEVNGFGGMALFVALACLDFDEDDRAVLDGDEIQFTEPGTDAATDDAESAASKKTCGNSFASFAQRAWAKERRQPVGQRTKRFHERTLAPRGNKKSQERPQPRRSQSLPAEGGILRRFGTGTSE